MEDKKKTLTEYEKEISEAQEKIGRASCRGRGKPTQTKGTEL